MGIDTLELILLVVERTNVVLDSKLVLQAECTAVEDSASIEILDDSSNWDCIWKILFAG